MENYYLTLALSLIGAGVALLVLDLFVPSHGLLSALGLVAMMIGVAVPFYQGDTSTGLVMLIGVMFLLPVLGFLIFYWWPKTPVGRRMFMTGLGEDETVANMPVILELERYRGRIGRAVSPLRPAGIVDFDGKRIDTITEGMMIDAGSWVRCIDVKAGKVIVRAIAEPKLGDLENADFP